MNHIQEIFIKFSAKILYSSKTLGNIKKVILAIIYCRTIHMGVMLFKCDDCGHEGIKYCSCRNRNCPDCLYYKKEEWINKRSCELINTKYFHMVFTVPDKLNNLILLNQEKMYDILFKSVKETILELGMDEKHLGAEVGAMLVLHTWCQKLLFHPHIHCVVTGGGLSDDKWLSCKKDIFIHVNVLSKVFRGKFMDKLDQLYKSKELKFSDDLQSLINPGNFELFKISICEKQWYVYSKQTFSNPRAVVEYLARYTHRIAICNSRIVSVDEKNVTFNYRDNKDGGKRKQMTLTGEEFVRRYLLHVLPRGFTKIRYVGIWGNRNRNTKLKRCQELTKTFKPKLKTKEQILQEITKGKVGICPSCEGKNFKLIIIFGRYYTVNYTNTA